jgi:site-specific DNA-cytosine methylase
MAGVKFERHYFSEIDPWCCELYSRRFPDALPLGDIREINGKALVQDAERDGRGSRGTECTGQQGRSALDKSSCEWILTGGFPCQDISVAGKGAGIGGLRSGLWFEYARLIGEIRPRYAIMENVGALTRRGLDRVLGSLAEIGYDAEWSDIRASDVGAPHRRERIWIVAYPQSKGLEGLGTDARESSLSEPRNGCPLPVTRSIGEVERRHTGLQLSHGDDGIGGDHRGRTAQHVGGEWWSVDAGFCRMVDELSKGLDGLDDIIISHYHVGYGKKTDFRSAKELQAVRETAHQEAILGKAGGQVELSTENLLQSGVYGSLSAWKVAIESLLEALPKRELRKLWDKAFSFNSSSGWEQSEQQSRKSGDVVLEVPHNMALAKREVAVDLMLRMRKESSLLGPMFYASNSIEEIWKSLSEAEKDWASVATILGSWHSEWPGIPRVAKGIDKRVDRLRGLGNAIVPQIAEMILKELFPLEEKCKAVQLELEEGMPSEDKHER